MALRYEIKADAGEYKDAQGQMKKKYVKIGVVLDGKNGGFILKMEAIPVGWNGWAFLAEPEQRGNRGGGGRPPPNRAPSAPVGGSDDGFDDDIPFN